MSKRPIKTTTLNSYPDPHQFDDEVARATADMPWLAKLILHKPELIVRHLHMLHERGHIPGVPNAWQVFMYVVYMTYRIFFRFNTVGTHASDPVRETRLAKIWENRFLRFPFLVMEGAVNGQYDMTGLGITVDRKIKHLVGAYHPGDNFMYDLALVDCYPGKLQELREKVVYVLENDDDRSRFIKDLVVYEDYHERLLTAIDRIMDGNWEMTIPENSDNPDTSIVNFALWCLKQPKTPQETWVAYRKGRVSFEPKVAVA